MNSCANGSMNTFKLNEIVNLTVETNSLSQLVLWWHTRLWNYATTAIAAAGADVAAKAVQV